MDTQKIDYFITTLAELSTFLVKVKHYSKELDEKNKVSEAVENYLAGFNFSSSHDETPAPKRDDVALKLNMQKNEVWTVKEKKDMPNLKDMKYRITKDGLHQFRYRRDGINVQITNKNFEVAKNKAREFILDLKRKLGETIAPKHLNTVDYVANLWFENKKHHVHLKTWQAYMSVYKNHIRPAFGNRSIAKILPMDLQPFFNDIHARLGKTCECSKFIMNGFFELAVANRICPNNPMKGVIVEQHCRKPGKALNPDELERFKKVMIPHGAVGTAFLIILYSGIRGAELERMTFDWNASTFTVYNAKLKKSQRRRVENLTRTVPIFPALWAMRDRIERDDWRFNSHRLVDLILKVWRECSVKDLRHTFTTKAREAHIENELVNLWTGHLPGKNVTANIYTHFSLEYQIKESKKLAPY